MNKVRPTTKNLGKNQIKRAEFLFLNYRALLDQTKKDAPSDAES